MVARFATERYCIKCTTSKTFAKIKIKGSSKSIGKKDRALGIRRTSGVSKRSWNNSEISKDHPANIRLGEDVLKMS